MAPFSLRHCARVFLSSIDREEVSTGSVFTVGLDTGVVHQTRIILLSIIITKSHFFIGDSKVIKKRLHFYTVLSILIGISVASDLFYLSLRLLWILSTILRRQHLRKSLDSSFSNSSNPNLS